MQALDIADEYNMELVYKKKCHFDCARNSTFEGLQTNATNYSLARGYFQVSFRARFIWNHKMSKCLFYEFVIE